MAQILTARDNNRQASARSANGRMMAERGPVDGHKAVYVPKDADSGPASIATGLLSTERP